MYVYPTPGRAAVRQHVDGDKSTWTELIIEQQDTQGSQRLQKLLLPVTSRPKGPQKTPSLIGYLGVARRNPFAEEEKEALKDAADFIGEYMHDVYAALHQQQCERARRRIEEMKHIHERSGTLVRHVQGVVHRAIHAHASYYCVIDGANICVEYYQRHTWNRPVFPNFHNSAQTVVTFRTLCERENYFQWVDIKEGRGLSSILFEYGQFGKGESEYLIGVIKDNNNPIAILIFQFYQGKIIIHEVYKEIILFAVSALYLPSRYLYQRRTKKLIIEPIFRGRETRVEQDMAFVLMPFSAEWSDRIWESFLKPILISEDFKPIRADNLFGPDIMEDIWAGILQARIVIGDITGRNANVFYELGMAHTLGKDVILLTQNINDIPFDLNRYRHIIYQDNHDGYNVLTEKLKAALQEIKRA